MRSIYTACLYYCVYGRSLVQCETTHGVYEFRRGFCTLVLSCYHVFVHLHTRTHTHAHTCTHTRTHAFIHSCTHAYTHPLHRVIQVAMSAGSGECVPVYGSRSEKIAHRGATLATLAKIWDHYGFRYVSSCTIRQLWKCSSCEKVQ